MVQFRAVDTSGNVSGVVTQTFKAPFPLSNTPNLDPKVLSTPQNTGPAMDCRGLFSGDFDGNGLVDVADELLHPGAFHGRIGGLTGCFADP